MGSSGLTRVLSLSIILCFPLSDLLSGLDLSPSGFISASPDLPHFLALPSPHDHLLLRDSDGKGKRKSKKRKKKKKKIHSDEKSRASLRVSVSQLSLGLTRTKKKGTERRVARN
jgi:hypothetical protein